MGTPAVIRFFDDGDEVATLQKPMDGGIDSRSPLASA